VTQEAAIKRALEIDRNYERTVESFSEKLHNQAEDIGWPYTVNV
jgi:hypothetical protein